ncbi:aspartate--tRNA ligase [Scatolibacter rhodanostii]|uniref:aspartate--tRNA ligase n=1 Tax=Scatolibacter rhodanostii TaxID=2014781 RepID=UPI000C074321|nr:aspartate--tRNA ligase [Scatolibacter rhodanostii]
METIHGLKRTKYCGEFRMGDVGQKAVVFGWAQRQRDLGQLIFIDLRDRTGLVQLAFDDSTDKAVFDKAFAVRSEFVLAAVGTVRERSSKNKDIPTGEIEIFVEELRILNQSETPPFEIIDETTAKEDLRLKYRYLDLRRPMLQRNLLMRHKIAKVTRDYFDDNGFIEIETPMLIKSTPEGAKDFIVPSRLHKGSFYALPQSPQLYKQLSMVAGFDRYFQIARCFRDEDLRANRQPEFTQIDVEMSFVEMDDVLGMVEGYISHMMKEVMGVEIPMPLPRITYKESMERFGSDKPDTRYGMEICDISDVVKSCGFSVFTGAIEGGGSVRAIVAKNAATKLTRKEIDKLTATAKGIGAKGLAWVRMTEEATTSSFAKFMAEEEMQAIYQKTGAETGDVILIIADTKTSHVLPQLGMLRVEVAKKLDIVPAGKHNFLWVVEMPFFEFDEDANEWVAMHHPFTSPLDECLPYLESDKGEVRAQAYDLVLNGEEMCSGSIRVTDSELQGRIFSLLGLTQEKAQEKFGYLLDAFKYGAPPHGGVGIGMDRLIMVLLEAESLRDVLAYPKVQSMVELMTNAPGDVDQEQLEELGITIATQEK